MLASASSQRYWQTSPAALLLGIFAEAVRPAFSAMMIDVVPERDRLRAFSLNYWAINLGFAVRRHPAGCAAQVDYLLLFVGRRGHHADHAADHPDLPGARPGRAAAVTRRADAPARPGLGTVFRDRVFVGFLHAANCCVVLVIMQHMSTLPIAMSARRPRPATFGSVIAVNGVLIVAASCSSRS